MFANITSNKRAIISHASIKPNGLGRDRHSLASDKRAMSGMQTFKCFIVFVPFFVLAVISGSIFDDLRSNDIPITVPAVKMTMAGQGITGVIVSTGVQFSLRREE